MKQFVKLGCLFIWIFMLGACSEDEKWIPFSVGSYSLDILPYEEVVIPIEGGVAPYTVEVEDTAVVTANIEPSEEVSGQWQLRICTHAVDANSLVWVTDAEGRVARKDVTTYFIQQNFLLKETETIIPDRLDSQELRNQLQSFIESEAFPMKVDLSFNFESPYSGYFSLRYFHDVKFKMDEEQEHMEFMLSTGETYRFSIISLERAEDNPDYYRYLRWWALPTLMWLEEDLTDECREMFPGVLMKEDKIMKRYCLYTW